MFEKDRLPALLALAIPVLTGAAWMAASGAPASYALVNIGALVLISFWTMTGRGPHTSLSRYMLVAALLLLLAYPAMFGISVLSITQEPVARWITIGSASSGISLHAGMLVAPSLAVLAARDRRYGAAFLLLGILAASFQPDAATGFALTFAAIGIHHVTRDWKFAIAAILGFLASVTMALSGEIAAQPFVERVLVQAAEQSVFISVLLAIALLASFLTIMFALPHSREKRFALAGALFGFAIMALMSNYPTPLIGYGAAPILGFGIALGLRHIRPR